MRLVTRADLARRAGKTRAAITKACKTALAPACTGDRIDLDHPAVARYLGAEPAIVESDEPPESDAVAPKNPPPAPTTSADGSLPTGYKRTEIGPLPDEIDDYLDLTLRRILQSYGTVRAFADWLDQVRKIETIRTARNANEEAESRLISRELVRKSIFAALDGLFRRLLTDFPKTMARRSYANAKADVAVEETERVIAELLGSMLEQVKGGAVEELGVEAA